MRTNVLLFPKTAMHVAELKQLWWSRGYMVQSTRHGNMQLVIPGKPQ